VRDVRIQHQSFPRPQPVRRAGGFDDQFTTQTVNHHIARSSMLRQATTGLECEQQDSQRPTMNQAGLPVTTLGRMRLSLESAGKIREIESYYGARKASARMRPEPLV
jgi:hypothetical protein